MLKKAFGTSAWSLIKVQWELDDKLAAILVDDGNFARPLALLQRGAARFVILFGVFLETQFLHRAAGRLVRSPAVDGLGAFVPEKHAALQVAEGDGIIGFVQQGGLLRNFFGGALALRDVLTCLMK